MPDRRSLLRFAEYAAVSASVVGAITTLATQKPAYAIAPLTVAAALNLVSRREQAQHFTKTSAQLTEQTSQLTPKVQQVNQRLDAIDQQGLGRQQQLENLSQALSQQNANATDTVQALQEIRQFVDQQQLPSPATIDSVSQLTDILRQTKEQVSAELTSIRADISTLATQTESTFVQQQNSVAETQQAVREQNSTQTTRETQLESRLLDLYTGFESLRADLESLALQFRRSTQATEPAAVQSAVPPDLSPDFSGIVPQLPTADDFDLDINLGIDFGTGYTKVCFRDLAREKSEVVTFANPNLNGISLDETLVPTRLAILEDGTLLTGLTVAEWKQCNHPIRQEINYIKMRLAAIDFRRDSKADEWRIERIPELDDDATVESLCAYYLSSVIKRSQQWIKSNRPDLFTNQTVRWSVNIGVPVEYCDSPALKRFNRVLALAWLLKSTEIDTAALTLKTLNQLIAHLQQWMDNNTSLDNLDCTTTPEIAAAVWSFLNSRQAQEGFYTFFDIGDGTLDGAAFIFSQSGGERQVDFYIGQVEPLGVTAFVEKTADELGIPADSVRASLSNHTDSDLQAKLKASKTHNRVQRLVARVVMDGNEKHHQARQASVSKDIGPALKVFVGGGGGNTQFFPQAIRATHGDFGQSSADIPPYDIRQIPTPNDLSINGLEDKHFNRFAIAYGLCIPEGEGPTIQLPSQFDTIESATELKTFEADSYEDTRDAT